MNINAITNFPSGCKFAIVDNFFEPQIADDVNALFALSRDQWSEDSRFSHNPGRLHYNQSHATCQAIDSYARQMQSVVGQAIDNQVEYVNHSLWLDLPGYQIPPHRDLDQFPEVAVQIYMGDPKLVWEMLGFCIYNEHNRPLFEMHYRINAGYICLHPSKINHGLNHHIPQQYVRNSVYMRFALK